MRIRKIEINNIRGIDSKGTATAISDSIVDVTEMLSITPLNTVIEEFDFLFNGHSVNEKLVNVAQLRELFRINNDQLSSIISYSGVRANT